MTEDTGSTDPLLTPAEAADLAGVANRTLLAWNKEGRLRAASRTDNGHRRYLASDLFEAVAKRETMVDDWIGATADCEPAAPKRKPRPVVRWDANKKMGYADMGDGRKLYFDVKVLPPSARPYGWDHDD